MSWKLVPLGYCVAEVKKKNAGGREENLLSLSYGNIVRRDIATADGLLPESFDSYNVINPGDTVLRLTDLQNDQRSLRVGLVEEVGIITSAYVTVRPSKLVHPKFLNYFLKHMDFRKDFYALGAGVRQSLKFDELRSVKVPVPALADQKAIADYLDTETARIDALIAKKQRMIELLTEHRRALITTAITGELEIAKGYGVSDRGWWSGETPATWKVGRLKDLVEVTNGYPFDAGRFSDSSGTPLIRMRDLLRGTTETYFDGPVPDVALVADGDLLIGISGDFNSGIWAGGAAALNQRMCRLRARPGLHQRFLRYLVDLPLRYLHDLTYSTTVKNLSIADLLDERFPCPPLEVQRTIADHLDCETARVDALIEKNQRMTELLGERRQTIITAAITGELNILGVAA